jgi:hypothetical protein
MGPMEPIAPALGLTGACLEDGESALPGEEVEVGGWSEPSNFPNTGFMPELGDEVLLAREGDWRDAAWATLSVLP